MFIVFFILASGIGKSSSERNERFYSILIFVYDK